MFPIVSTTLFYKILVFKLVSKSKSKLYLFHKFVCIKKEIVVKWYKCFYPSSRQPWKGYIGEEEGKKKRFFQSAGLSAYYAKEAISVSVSLSIISAKPCAIHIIFHLKISVVH